MLLAAFFGSVCGLFGTWLIVCIAHLVRSSDTQPFSAGDLVVVMRGPHLGATGTAKELSKVGRGSVFFDLKDKACVVVFSYYEIQK